MAADAEDRTEAATAKRLERARGEGNVPLSREATTAAVLVAAALALAMFGADAARVLIGQMAAVLGALHTLDPAAAVRDAARAALAAAAPLVLAALIAGAAAVLLQTGFLLRAGALMPDLARLDPRRGLSRIFGRDTLVETGKSLAKLALAGAVAWSALAGLRAQLLPALGWEAGTLADALARVALRVLLWMAAAQAALAALDLLRTRGRHAADLRMSRHEIKEEHKETEGDPRIKARIRQIRHARARRRMMAAVPKATVIVTNPTHYAVALAYDRAAGGAPRVVAKGVDDMAARIRSVAQEHRVPLVPNPALARALWRVELDAEIPPEHFKVVAEIIAYVWRLRGRRQ